MKILNWHGATFPWIISHGMMKWGRINLLSSYVRFDPYPLITSDRNINTESLSVTLFVFQEVTDSTSTLRTWLDTNPFSSSNGAGCSSPQASVLWVHCRYCNTLKAAGTPTDSMSCGWAKSQVKVSASKWVQYLKGYNKKKFSTYAENFWSMAFYGWFV